MPQFAEVILPLAVQGTYTYRIPASLSVGVGYRVLVPFGRKKYYTAIVVMTHDIEPQGYKVKEILALLDEGPVLRHPQLKFWQWIADYYLCTVGEVYKAAVPSGLKVESETFISPNPDFEEETPGSLSDREKVILDFTNQRGKVQITELSSATGFKNVESIVSRLLDKGAVHVAEKVMDNYRPKTETCVRLTIERDDEQALHAFFDKVHRAKKQEQLLLAYLDLSHWLQRSKPVIEVTQEELLKRSGCTQPVLAAARKNGIFEIYKREINRFEMLGTGLVDLPTLSPAQDTAYKQLHNSLNDKAVTLLHGVTSSGKTSIYMHLINDALQLGKQVLYLVPEIALTTQLTQRLQRVFGERLLIYHSKFSDNERVDIWKKLLTTSEPCVIIGVRSSVFLPYSKLGLVIVDEEHDSSYKQQDPAPRYNGRDTAILLAHMHGAKTVLGSATPAIDTYHKALTGQVILFQNRRGYAPMVRCKQCAWVPTCINCDVSLTYHRRVETLTCHYCGHTITLPTVCPACGSASIEVVGYGTERIEDEIDKVFPGEKISRMDLDTTRNKASYDRIINEFSQHKTSILVGTQMVTKGLDFDAVSIVGILNADTMIHFPDFRSSERAFNMMEQVAGRAGRAHKQGKVLIQTSDPNHPVIERVVKHDYKGFYNQEIADREKFGYPPFTKIINIYLKHKQDDVVLEMALRYSNMLRQVFGQRVLGPEAPLVARVQTMYIRQIVLKMELTASMVKVKKILRDIYEQLLAADSRMRSTRLYFDVDPS